MEIELQVAQVATAVPAIEVNLDLRQRVDAPDQLFVGTFAPEQLHVLGRSCQRLFGHRVPEQLLERHPAEVVAAE
ncbi:MAG: hypothetical protein IPF84_14160 [Proteobacteria bacterium]|nr:hypothetical protein [Pseudomonadota bacterium]